MELDTIINTRRSIRKYKNQPIEIEKVKKIIKAAVEAESWKNSQTARYHIITSNELLIEFKKTCLPEFNQENCKDAPVLIVSTFIKNRSGFERDGTASNELGNGWGCYDLGIHNQNLILKATELGIGSLIMGIRNEKKIRTLLNIPASEIIVSVIALGISDIEPERPKRKNIDEICKFY
ncbi:nitroreductase family protein [Thomasclavelia cocleata]|jgi:nitroreductase|uniref:nitroreductase family protein n=3 Tax=Thomasclavelia cocleata TaxID=69824 RepID=UPI00241EF0A4|nr:nitroreductase family protein [Thomasclavelia cocleata]